ncbi:efflux RND transporter periplasmic adaptor subunit [Pseudomonadales bacterium]|nr:efflux RND transporter periplasmic adaptor subunit [Pseudomonadales bacterium]
MQDQLSRETADVLAVLRQDPGSGRRSIWLKWMSVGLVVILTLAAVSYWLFVPAEVATGFKTVPVSRQDLSVAITATGKLAPVNQVDVGSELSGKIISVKVDFNDQVKTDQVLARLETAELDASVVQYRAALQLARARVDQAQATLTETNIKYQRRSDLVAQQLAPVEDLDTSTAALARANADLAAATAQVEQSLAALDAATSKLAKAVIRAPISGIVLSRNVEPGQTVAAAFNTPILFSLAEDLRRMTLHVDVDEADVGSLQQGQSAMFTVDAYPGRNFAAIVTQVRYAPRTVEGVVTYETLLDVTNDDLSLRPGMTATAEIQTALVANALVVPNSALRFVPPDESADNRPGGSVFAMLVPRHRNLPRTTRAVGNEVDVWVLDGGEPRAVKVDTGLTDGRYTVIDATGIEAGTLVITGLQGAN